MNISDFFLRAKNLRTANRIQNEEFQLNVEQLEPRMMLNGDVGNVVFQANFEDVNVDPNGFAFFSQVSGLTATGLPVEIQHNHPSVGPASEGQQHLELDGVNGVAVDIVAGTVEKLLLQVDYSARPGVAANQNSIEVYWNDQLIQTLSEDGRRLRKTNFHQFEIELPGASGRLEFRSNSPDDEFGLGGLIDNVKVLEKLGPIQLAEIADQDVFLGSELKLSASLLAPNENLTGAVYSIANAPAGMQIDPATGEITWVASQENIDNSDNEDDQVIIGDPVLKFQSGFEDANVDAGGFAFFSTVSGFTATPGVVEIQNNHPSVGGPSEGSNHLELDGVNAIHRDVATKVGDKYELVFDYSPRPSVSAADNAIEVWWNGELLETVTAEGKNLRRTRFNEYRFDLSDFTGDLTRLEFRSNSDDIAVGLGGLLDNVRLYHRTVEVITGTTGKYEITVEVSDGNGRTDTETFTVCVQEGEPVAPVLSEIVDQTITEAESLDLTLTATDTDSTAAQLKFELVSGPAGATVDEATGKVAWSPTEADGPGQFDFEVKVSDQSGLSDTKSFVVDVTEVNEAPVISTISNQTVTEGQSLTVDFDATDSDLPANTLKFSIVSGPDGAAINESTGELTFAPTETQAGSTFSVEVKVDDGAGGSATTTFDVTVEALPDRPPVLTAVADQTVNEGEQLEVFLMATDPDSPTDQLTFELVSGPIGLAVAGSTGQLTWTPTEAQGPGDYDVVVKVTDETSLSDTKTFKVTVAEVNVAPVIAAIEDQVLADGESINLTVAATDTDVPANTLVYAIDAGPVGATIDSATGAFSWTPTAAQTPGVYDLTVSVSDGAGGSDTETFQIRVNVVNESPVLAAIQDQTIDENTTLSVQAVATDGDLPAQTIVYSLLAAPAGATIDGATGVITWATGEAEGPGTYDFTVVATDSENATDEESFQVTVNEVNVAPVLAAIADQTVTQNQLLAFTATATDADLPANTLTYGLSGTVPDGLTIDATTGGVSWTPINATTIGDYEVIVTVSDGNGGSDMATVKITVTPELAGILLMEGEDFETTHEETIEITADTKELVFEFAESFDKTDANFVNDAFEVALLDADGNSLVHTINPSRDSFFNFTEEEFVATGVNTIVDGSTVKLDLSHIAEGTTAKLVFRLVNNDSDTETQVRITDLETTDNLLNTSIGASFSAAAAQPEQTIDFAALTDVTGSVGVNYGQTSFDADSGNLYTDVNLTNNANHPIDGPFVLVVHSITDPTVVVSGSSGVTPDGNRYYLMDDSTETNTIESGASTLSKTLEFFNPNEVQFGYQISVLAQPNIAPEFVTSPNNEGEAGVAYTYDAEATDADNDFLVYELMAGPEGLTVDSETGLINWMPETEDLGRHSVIVEVADGRGGKDMQQYDIEVVEDRPNRPPVIVSTPVVEAFVKPVSEGDGTNLVVNGNFEDGNVGFETDLTHTPNSLLGASTYAIVTDPQPLNGFATSYGDHTTGEGNMMGINGATSPNTVWRQTVGVSQDVTYYFAGFVSSMFPEAISRLTLWVNDEQVDDLAVPNETGQWELVVASWDSGDATTAKLEIRNSVTAFRGNDFALDDIYFGTEPRAIANYVYQTEAIDPDLDPIGYQLDSAPTGMAIDSDSGLITWNPTSDQLGVHTVVVTANDGRGGTATQEYQVRVFADPTNTAPVIVSDPVDDFFVPGFSNPASGDVTPQRISLDLGNGETFEGTVSITLPESASRFADIVLAVDESASMSGDQAWVAEMIPLLDAALIDAGIGTVAGSPNRFAILGFGGGRDQISVGHFLNSQAKTKYTLYGPDNVVVAEGLFNDVLPDELLNLDLPTDGRYVLVVEAQDNADLANGIDIGVEGQTGEAVRVEDLTLNTIVEDVIAIPGQRVQYNFSLSVDTLIYFDSLAKDDRIQWALSSPTGTVVENINFNQPIRSVLLAYDLPAGDYQLTIDSRFDIPADYKFQVLDLTAARTISSGEIVSGEFELKAETFAYQFNAEAGQVFEFANSTTGVHSQSPWRLLNEAGEEVLVNEIGVNQPRFTLESTGVYYLLMESNLSPKEGNSQLRVPSLFEFAATISDPAPPIEVVLGDVISGEIDYSSQFVDYSFSLDERSLIYVDSLVNSGISWTLNGPRGTEVNNLRFLQTDSFDNSDPVLDLVAGDYALRINSNNQVGEFAFRVVDLAGATEITPGTPFDGELTIANETDLYRFAADEGSEFYFDVESASDVTNAQYKLIDPFGQVIFISNRLSDQATTTIPRNGIYTLLVEGWRGNEDADTYTINIVPVVERVVAMTLGSQVNETITTPGERVAFTFDLADDALLYFDSLTNDPSIVWSLEGPAGNEIERRLFTQSDAADVASPTISARAGSYQLVLQRTADSVGDFSFALRDLLSAGATSPIAPNPGSANTTVNVAGTIATNETQLYRFNAEPGDQFSFDASATGSTNAYYRIVDSIGTEIVPDTRVSSDRNDIVFVAGGEYYLLIEGRFNNDAASEYSLDINWIQNNGPTVLAGSPLVLNTTVTGDLATDGQVDQFTFTLTERTLLYLDSLTNSGTIRWNLHGPAGTAVSNRAFTATDSFNNSNPVGEFVAGEYQLEIYASSGTPGAYGFRAVDLASAVAITPGTAFDGELDPANETNLYRFDAAVGEQFYFDVETVSDVTNTQYKLIDPYGSVVFISNRMNDTDVQTVDFDGTYTLLVEGWRGNTDLDTYTVNVHRLSPTSSALTLGTPVSDSIDTPGEVATYSFSLADRQQIVFDSNTNSVSFNWTLEGPQGTVIAGRRFNASDSSSLNNNTVLDLPAGDYQLTVDGTGDATGPFGFALLNLADATAINVGDVVQETLAISIPVKHSVLIPKRVTSFTLNGLGNDANSLRRHTGDWLINMAFRYLTER